MIYTPENTYEIGRPVLVYVDGVEISYAIKADTEKGVVTALETNEDGIPKISKCGTEFVYSDIHGVVTVEPAV